MALADGASPANAGRVCMQLKGWESWGLDVSKRLKLMLAQKQKSVSGSVELALVSGLCPKLFGDQRDRGNNPQVELMLLCSTQNCQHGF